MSLTGAKARREEDREKRRIQIIRAAAELFARKGLENVTFGEIARRARLSRPLVYFYFPDQRSLFLETVLQAHERLRARFAAAIEAGGQGISQIEGIGRAYVQFQKEDPTAFQLCTLYDANPTAPADPGDMAAAGLQQSEVAVHRLCAQAISNGLADGSIRSDVGRPEHVATVLWACMHGLAQLAAMRGNALQGLIGLGADDLIEEGIRLLRRSLVPAAAGSGAGSGERAAGGSRDRRKRE